MDPSGFPAACGPLRFRPGPRTRPTWAKQPAWRGHDFTHNTFRAMAAAPPGQEGATPAPHSARAGTAPPRFRRPRYPLPAPQGPAPWVSRKPHPQPRTYKAPPPPVHRKLLAHRPRHSAPRLSALHTLHSPTPHPIPQKARVHSVPVCPTLTRTLHRILHTTWCIVYLPAPQPVNTLHPHASPPTRAPHFAMSSPASPHCWLVDSTTVLFPHPNNARPHQAQSYTLYPQIYSVNLVCSLVVGGPAVPWFPLPFFWIEPNHTIRLTKAWPASPHPVFYNLSFL